MSNGTSQHDGADDENLRGPVWHELQREAGELLESRSNDGANSVQAGTLFFDHHAVGGQQTPPRSESDGFGVCDYGESEDEEDDTPDFESAMATISSKLKELLLTGPRLACQKGKERELLGQLAAELSLKLCWSTHIRVYVELNRMIDEACTGEPRSKRLRGELMPPCRQRLLDEELGRKQGLTQAEADRKLELGLPPRGTRSLLRRKIQGRGHKVLEEKKLKKWTDTLTVCLMEGDAPCVHVASRSQDPHAALARVILRQGSTL